MKHKHYDMIVAKAENMDLVKFVKFDTEWMQQASDDLCAIFDSRYEYFLCLPEHTDSCLCWLNGGVIQSYCDDEWGNTDHVRRIGTGWSYGCMFMDEDEAFRIAPKKEKYWIGVDKMGCCTNTFKTRDDVIGHLGIECEKDWQLVEIELEV